MPITHTVTRTILLRNNNQLLQFSPHSINSLVWLINKLSCGRVYAACYAQKAVLVTIKFLCLCPPEDVGIMQ